MTDASTVIMKTLSNNKGAALIILIIAMTLISVLGASMVSIMGAKQRGFIFQSDSYRALNLANAGVEYAILYLSDSLKDTNSQYLQDPNQFQNLASPVVKNLSANESFSFFYNYNNDRLSVSGLFGNSNRQVALSNFRRYMDSLTFQYDPAVPLSSRKPYRTIDATNYYINVPIINNNNLSISVPSINVTTTNLTYVKRLDFVVVATTRVYEFTEDGTYGSCFWNSPPCKDTSGSDIGIRIRSGTTLFTFTRNTPYAIPGNTVGIFRLTLDRVSGTDPLGKDYVVGFNYRIGAEATMRSTALPFRL